MHTGDVPVGTFQSILKQAGISEEAFRELRLMARSFNNLYPQVCSLENEMATRREWRPRPRRDCPRGLAGSVLRSGPAHGWRMQLIGLSAGSLNRIPIHTSFTRTARRPVPAFETCG